MIGWIKKLVSVAALLSASLLAQAALTEGREFKMLTPNQPTPAGKIEIVEFFWYGCPHCHQLEPELNAWSKKLPADVSFRREHIAWPGRSDLENHVKLFLALRTLGLEHKHSEAVFKAIHNEKMELRKEDVLNKWLAQQAIDPAKFMAVYKSFSMPNLLVKQTKLTTDYKVDGVPMFVVNGKLVTSPSAAGGNKQVLQVLDQLIAMERTKLKK